MRFASFIAVALPALALAAPTPQDPDYTFPEDAPDEDIVGGTTAAAAEFPFIVSLQIGGEHFCGGSLINANTVVTAAHCSVRDVVSPISGLRVRVGSNSRTSGGTLVGVTSVTVNPGYVASRYDGDVAVWKLATSIPTSSTVGYATLPAANSDPAAGSTLTVAGWGTTTSGGTTLPVNLLKVSVPVVSRATCRSEYGTSAITNNMFCAGQGGKDSCQGDSGGPIVNSAKVLVGVVSWGNACADAAYPGVYTRLSTLLSFIAQYD